MELAQGRTALENARVSQAQYQRQVKQDRNGLALLLGTEVPVLEGQPATLAEVKLAAIPVGAPSSLLQQRPDILAAEHSLKAANANIGAARAAFFPTISLTATAGTASNQLSGLFDGGTGTWTFMPQINLPIFDGGKRVADLDVAEVGTKQAVASYEKSIQTAFKEVADTLGAQADYQQQLQAQQDLVDANQTYFKLAEFRYEQGVDSYLTRLDAQRSLFSARQGLISTRLAQLSNQVALYKAVGGGWQAPKEAPAASEGQG
jgi:multidrug efflux system outer membrane protein